MQYPQVGPLHIQCSTSKQLTSRLGLNLFRGEPAISEFDWNFSASHKSSAHVSGYVGSVLHMVLPILQPAHGQITRFRVYCIILCRPIKTRFPFGSVSISLPSRGSFHLSLTVLVHYRSLESIQPCGMVPADSDKISRVSPYSGSLKEFTTFRLQDFHLVSFTFPSNSTIL